MMSMKIEFMKRILKAAVLLFVMIPLGCDSTVVSGDDGEDVTVELPEPPEQIVGKNVFVIDFFSTLEDDGSFFEMRAASVAASHIAGQTDKRPVMYLFDRADAEAGKSNPAVEIALEVKAQPFFAQNRRSSDKVEGTGIVTPYMVSDYDGAAVGEYFMSGCTVPVPLSEITPVCVFTARIDDAAGAGKVFEEKSDRLVRDAVVVGTVSRDAKDELAELLAFGYPTVRVMFYGSEDTEYDLFVLVPGSFVCRSIESLRMVNLPYYRISIEKLQ